MSNDIFDTLGDIGTFKVSLSRYKLSEALSIARQYLQYQHYYYDKGEKVWKYTLKKSDGTYRIWYGRVLRNHEEVRAVYGFTDKSVIKACKLTD